MSTLHVSQQAPVRLVLPNPPARGDESGDAAQIRSGYDDEIAGIVDRLEQRYPREVVSGFDLEGRVRRVYRQFGTAHVRTFVAIFVERVVRRSIDEPSVAAFGAVAV
ncbi:three-helix bundle dimerization domain-containing protein [Phytohabitans sp. LJ34]|uniref:three-helix bundle dimerization domain-containing protein n=1 Tax=Phytohabitans sp. LJ34 TaxID=3452217 RepID=UPI003F88EE84